MNRLYNFCGWLWIVSICFGTWLIVNVAPSSKPVATVIGLVCTVFCVLVGMLTALMMERKKRDTLTCEEVEKRPEPEQVKPRDITIADCREMSLRVSRVLADRVSDRLVAKLSMLHNDEQREAAFSDADQIVDEEMHAISTAMEGIEEELLPK